MNETFDAEILLLFMCTNESFTHVHKVCAQEGEEQSTEKKISVY